MQELLPKINFATQMAGLRTLSANTWNNAKSQVANATAAVTRLIGVEMLANQASITADAAFTAAEAATPKDDAAINTARSSKERLNAALLIASGNKRTAESEVTRLTLDAQKAEDNLTDATGTAFNAATSAAAAAEKARQNATTMNAHAVTNAEKIEASVVIINVGNTADIADRLLEAAKQPISAAGRAAGPGAPTGTHGRPGPGPGPGGRGRRAGGRGGRGGRTPP